MVAGAQDLMLPGIGSALRVTGCRVFPKVLEAALPGWPLRAVSAGGPAPPIRVDGEVGAYRLVSDAFPEGVALESPVEVAGNVIVDLIEQFLDQHPEWVGLHCATVEVNGRLVLFPECHRSGKSTLTAALAGAGQRIFGDDVLVLDREGQGMALGIAPRLRLPLPASVDVALHTYTAAHAGPEDQRYRFLALPAGQLARHDESLPLGAVVLLERDERLETPELIPLAPSEGLTRLLRQHFAHDLSSEALMTRFLPLMQSLPCRLLRYSEPLQAARCLGDLLPGVIDGPGECADETLAEPAAETRHAPVAIDEPWRATTHVREYTLEDERFLILQPSGAIHRLNATGQLIWGLLRSEPMTAREIVELLAGHFNDVPAERIDADVRALLGGLHAAGLVVPD
ncbi:MULTISPECIES: PqqD family peptide modification chaperone [unclassified Guyparkeria]|uniref:PqqD family peptide modification chaperone n=1 Tax=unclassified Guyparkeria TaxID=2626246 RepID=UPI0007336080|nr:MULTISPECIES: PqqD family peptide modification chaperone [unclassified Guyparkeria]KTG17542.1 hypothetical protein AUR63_07760 [Guyparkeria sp. XI15]OAE88357.1 hypothetical protein AWR35_07775 [Guyparkeria sp. WRN-7]